MLAVLLLAIAYTEPSERLPQRQVCSDVCVPGFGAPSDTHLAHDDPVVW